MRNVTRTIADAEFYSTSDSPVGRLTLLGRTEGLCGVLWDVDVAAPASRARLSRLPRRDRHPLMLQARRELAEYFAGERTSFDVPIVLHGTEFQQQVWRSLLEIPYGKTVCYQDQARKLGDTNRVRAVASANGRNPLSILVPCHRVVGKDGGLTGFAGGLDRKRRLLDLERRRAALTA